MSEYVIGCDVGSQSAKAVVLTLGGALAGEAASGYAIEYPQPLWAEQPPERWLAALAIAVRGALAAAGVRPEQVRALGIAAQVDGLVLVDADGRPIGPALIWMDRRAGAQADAARRAIGEQRARERTGLNLDASHVALKIGWLAEHRPAACERAVAFMLPGSYLAFALTGEHAVDFSNASSTLLLDVHTRAWSPELCALFGVDMGRLGRLAPAAAPLGGLRPAAAEALGLRPGTLVVVGCGDEHAACLGAGVLRAGLAADIAGTAEPVCAASATPALDPTGLLETHCHADPETWLIENPGFVSGANLRWYRDTFCSPEVLAAAGQQASAYALLDAQAACLAPGASGLIFLPCLMGAMTPTWNDRARGTLFGLTLAHTRAHVARAILEGTAYGVRDCTDRMRALGLPLRELRVVGGGSRSRLWNQIKADVTGLPVSVPRVTETTALGGALLALVGCGAHASLAEACADAVAIATTLEPQPHAQASYEPLYQLYRQLYAALLPAFDAAARLGSERQADAPNAPR